MAVAGSAETEMAVWVWLTVREMGAETQGL
jgi:hypothetical protein